MGVRNVLSLFDGISCGRVALERAGIGYENYYASEIDKFAIKVAQDNFPDTIQLGDVKGWREWDLQNIGLLMGGSPCQGFSISGKKLNFNDPRSKLFFDFVDILHHYKPKYFLFENVGSMNAEVKDKISDMLGVQPLHINSSLLSAQHRNRYYWTNIPEDKIEPKEINFKDILETGVEKKYYYSDKVLERLDLTDIKRAGKAGYKAKGIEVMKCSPIVARHYKGMQSQHYPVVKEIDGFRKLTLIECERLQTLPDNYTQIVSNSQRYKAIGNGWTVDVITHILNNIK